ncbi:hypothetical protein, partial [Escherichia coli]|uniref:hypothetical protein n=1 Tax=Escherichia coli TaxID=562 RepID=UPI0018D563CC
PLALHVDRDAVLLQRAIGERRDAGGAILRLERGKDAAAIMFEKKGDIWTCHRKTPHHIEAGGIFAAARAQELAAGGHARKQFLDHD